MATHLEATVDLWSVLSESKRIINAHSRHFLALSVIFLLPLSFSLIVYPTLQELLNDSFLNPTPKLLLRFSFQDQPITKNTIFLFLVYSLFVLIFYLCALGAISFSVFHGFYGRPVKLIPAIKSLFTSFFPLLATVIVSQIIVSLITFVFGILVYLLIRGIELLDFRFEYSSPYFLSFCAVFVLTLLFVLVYLQVNWTLVAVIVVVESSWGLEPLRRSTNLIKGMKVVALSSLLFFGFLAGILIWSSTVSKMQYDGANYWWKSWGFVVQIVMTSTFLMLLLLYNTAANTVLYMYCKAVHGELALEIAQEFAREYVSLPFDDGKVPQAVSVFHV